MVAQEKLIYQKLSIEVAEPILKKCEFLNIRYDIWNAEDVIMGGNMVELGMGKTDWEKIHSENRKR